VNLTFWLDYFGLFELLSTQASSSSENKKKAADLQTSLFEKKGMDYFPWKSVPLLVGIDFLMKKITNLTSNFAWKK
jgi:hypothetical protein